MITATITNIVPDGNRLRAFYQFSNGIEESNLFQPEAVLQDIVDYGKQRVDFFNEIEAKAEEFNKQILDITIE